MLKTYLKEREISIYSLASQSELPYSTVNDLANRKVDVEKCKAGILKKLSTALNITMDELYDICLYDEPVAIEDYGVSVRITVKGKRYHSEFTYNGEQVDLDICKVSEANTMFIRDFARWDTEDYLDIKFVEEFR